ncbi:MAG: cytochrome c peroxidase [Idiomarinaceae bacterium HL-53]|nr:MAG: cytochrome c peroxidase [Idiomarinaceae bacterium HL-53]CUS47229.1 cytochrome c peroxidase [Idiomarinaceae bacterium HL-53]
MVRKRIGIAASIFLLSIAHSLAADAVVERPELQCELKPSELAQHYFTSKEKWPCAGELPGELEALPPAEDEPEALVILGEMLFTDPRLSGNGTISCASCHQPEKWFADDRRISPGVEQREGHRTTPTLMNVDLWQTLFWDSRSNDLVALAEEPLTNPVEMDSSPAQAVAGIMSDPQYLPRFEAAFGSTEITWQKMANALAAFQRTLRSPSYRYEAFLQAIENREFEKAQNLISDEELLGLHLFRTRARCARCHFGPLLSDGLDHNMGLHYFGRRFQDLGVYEISKLPEDVGKFRTPTLRHLNDTAPWMHNGLFDSLLGIVRMYSHGGPRPKPRGDNVNNPLFPTTTDELVAFELSAEEEQALVKFLEML